MKCVIVAAGMSTRMRPLTDAMPKCLLQVGGKTILERTITSLHEAGITNIALVIGFEGAKIRSFLMQRFPDSKFRYILNPNFTTTNNAYSLLLASDFFLEPAAKTKPKDRLIVLDADIVFHPGVLAFTRDHVGAGGFAVRRKGDHDGEEVGVCADQEGFVRHIGKGIAQKEFYGESIGIEWFDYDSAKLLFEILNERVVRGSGRTDFYESAFEDMIAQGKKIRAVDIGALPAVEIDTPEDLANAERSIVPRIDAPVKLRIR